MSDKQDVERIKLRAQRECINLRVSMKERDCSEDEIEEKCQEILERAEERVAAIQKRKRRLSPEEDF